MRTLCLTVMTIIVLMGPAQAEGNCARQKQTAASCLGQGCETEEECRAWRAAILAIWRKDKLHFLSNRERLRFTRQGIGHGGLGAGDIFRRRPLRPKS